MKLQAKAVTVFERVTDSLVVVAAIFVLFMMIAVTYDVIMRKIFGSGTMWVIDVSSYMLLYITFLGTAWLLRREGHVVIDFVLIRLKPRHRALLLVITSIVGALITLAFTWYGAKVTIDVFQRGLTDVTEMRLPLTPIMAIIPTGFFLLSIQFLRRAYGGLKSISKHNELGEPQT